VSRVDEQTANRVMFGGDWPAIHNGNRDAYLHLYESFLTLYDPALRHIPVQILTIEEDRQPSGSVYEARGATEMILAIFEAQRLGMVD